MDFKDLFLIARNRRRGSEFWTKAAFQALGVCLLSAVTGPLAIYLFGIALRRADVASLWLYLSGMILLFLGFFGGQAVGALVYGFFFSGRRSALESFVKAARIVGIFIILGLGASLATNWPRDMEDVALTTLVVAPAITLIGFKSSSAGCDFVNLILFIFDLSCFIIVKNPILLGPAWICLLMASSSYFFRTRTRSYDLQ